MNDDVRALSNFVSWSIVESTQETKHKRLINDSSSIVKRKTMLLVWLALENACEQSSIKIVAVNLKVICKYKQ